MSICWNTEFSTLDNGPQGVEWLIVIGFTTGKGRCGKGGKGKGKIYLYHTLGKGEGKCSLPTIW